MSPITTHVLDTAMGRPAVDLEVRLERQSGDAWELLASRRTNADGRISDLTNEPLRACTHRITFDTGAYFARDGRPVFYPVVSVVFSVLVSAEHHHIPLLLSPFGYSTYRGS